METYQVGRSRLYQSAHSLLISPKLFTVRGRLKQEDVIFNDEDGMCFTVRWILSLFLCSTLSGLNHTIRTLTPSDPAAINLMSCLRCSVYHQRDKGPE